jgi:flagellar motor switch protein FliN/FliY
MELTAKALQMREWLLAEWLDKLCLILESMADERPSVQRLDTDEGGAGPNSDCTVWMQTFSGLSEAPIWIAVHPSFAIACGRRTLQAAGVESADETEAVNTFSEILSQSLSALGQAISAHLLAEANAVDGGPVDAAPPDVQWIGAQASFKDERLEPFWMAAAPALLEKLGAGAASSPADEAKIPAPIAAELVDGAPPETANSKTFDLLLDVALPVCISFGRTFLPIKDVLKLTTGSIVELDRTVSEPVDVIVNNCVIARGEVVVVEGNYGVRINQIATRFDRLKTGSATTEAQNALVQR